MKTRGLTRSMVWILFFLTGFSGLVYEILWTRELSLVFGNTTAAVSVVLAAFMGGLALGALLFGKAADRTERPLLLYAGLEALVALSAFAFPLVYRLPLPALRFFYQEGNLTALSVVRFLAVFLYLLIPTAAMGGSLPALARLLVRVESAGRTLAALYGINTIGAVLGALLAGFFAIPTWGLSGTLAAAIGINLTVALIAACLGASRSTRPVPASREPALPSLSGIPSPVEPYEIPVVLCAFGLSGAVALGLEVLWTRSLLLVFGSTVYSFTTMVAVFLAGLAAGSFVMGRMVERLGSPVWALGLLEGGVALVTLASLRRFTDLPFQFLDGIIEHGLTWQSLLTQKFLISAGILFPVAFLFGGTLPLVARIQIQREASIAGRVGLFYGVNTLGAIGGSLCAGFLLLPTLGLQTSITILALCALSLGMVLSLAGSRPSFAVRLTTAALLLVAGVNFVFWTPQWDRRVLSASVYFHPRLFISPDGKRNLLGKSLEAFRVVEYLEGITSTVAVVDTPSGRGFLVDGKVEASTVLDDMRLQRLMGHLPLLVAPNPKKVLNIGLGSGITLGAVATHPVETLHCVELEPCIPTAARHFSRENHGVLEDPRLEIFFNDGRNHLLYTRETYDVITSDPFEPMVGGAASLYTEEHFRLGKARLNPGGLFCQYLPLYELLPDDYEMIVRTFCRVFPHVTLWYTGVDTILLGSERPVEIDPQILEERMGRPGVKESLGEVGVLTPMHLLQTFVLSPSPLAEMNYGGLVNTDRRPVLEFSAPRSYLVPTKARNLEWLVARRRWADLTLRPGGGRAGEISSDTIGRIGGLVLEGALAAERGNSSEALELLYAAWRLAPGNPVVRTELLESANFLALSLASRGRSGEAAALLAEIRTSGEASLPTLERLLEAGPLPQAESR